MLWNLFQFKENKSDFMYLLTSELKGSLPLIPKPVIGHSPEPLSTSQLRTYICKIQFNVIPPAHSGSSRRVHHQNSVTCIELIRQIENPVPRKQGLWEFK
jgi:hypothetical protein